MISVCNLYYKIFLLLTNWLDKLKLFFIINILNVSYVLIYCYETTYLIRIKFILFSF